MGAEGRMVSWRGTLSRPMLMLEHCWRPWESSKGVQPLGIALGTARFVGELGSKALRMPQSAYGALVGVPIESYLWAEADVHGVWSYAPKPRCHVPKRGRVGHQQLVAATTHQPYQGYNHWNQRTYQTKRDFD